MKPVVLLLALTALIASASCRKKSEVAPSPNIANRVAMRDVRLYYESPQMLLSHEARKIALPESAAGALPIVVRELMKGPATPASLRIWPEDTTVRGAYLLPGGTAVVDVGGETLTAGWTPGTHHELMAIHSLVHTVTVNFPEARRVRLLLNGTAGETLAGHVSLARSHTQQSAMVEPQSR